MASGEVVEAGESGELGGDLLGFSDLKEVHEGKHRMRQEKGRLDAKEWMKTRAGLRAFEAEDVDVVEDVVGYRLGMKGSSWVDNAGMALP